MPALRVRVPTVRPGGVRRRFWLGKKGRETWADRSGFGRAMAPQARFVGLTFVVCRNIWDAFHGPNRVTQQALGHPLHRVKECRRLGRLNCRGRGMAPETRLVPSLCMVWRNVRNRCDCSDIVAREAGFHSLEGVGHDRRPGVRLLRGAGHESREKACEGDEADSQCDALRPNWTGTGGRP